jgi:hypothetical protein
MNPHFASLILGLGTQATAALEGKLPAEAAGANPRDVARALIDTLGVLEEKTRGNLDADEQRILTEVLTNLRIRFVQEGR